MVRYEFSWNGTSMADVAPPEVTYGETVMRYAGCVSRQRAVKAGGVRSAGASSAELWMRTANPMVGGDAPFSGSMAGKPLNKPVVGIAADNTGWGYWLVGADGGVFAFGGATFLGSTGSGGLAQSVVGIAARPEGYGLTDTGGNVVTYNRPASGVRDTLFRDQRLNPGEQLVSGNGRYRAVMQGDGNFVVYDPTRPVWATATNVPGSFLINQSDGNMVVVAPDGRPLWASATNVPGSTLVMQDDRNLVVYAPPTRRPVWSTNTGIAL